MEETILYILISLFFLFLAQRFYRARTSQKKLPPSPLALPIIGHFYLRKQPMYRVYYNIAKKYGPIFCLRFGSRKLVVVSSMSTIDECFNRNDIVLGGRPRFSAGKYFGYNFTSIDQTSYGEHWRNLRRVSKVEFLSTPRLNTLVNLRKEEVNLAINKLSRNSLQDFAKVKPRPIFQDLSYNILMRMITGKRYSEDDDVKESHKTIIQQGKEFKLLMGELTGIYDPSNPGDFFPMWNLLDGGRSKKRVKDVFIRMDKFMQDVVDESRRNLSNESMDTLVNNLLRLQKSEPDYYTDEIIKGFIFFMMFAGIEGISVVLEWTIARLLRHPEVLSKLKDELDTHIGKDTLLDELDASKLPYLQNVIKETMRLHPSTPVIDPHLATEDCIVAGYLIPKDTIVLANLWTLHRDPALWDDPETYKPERFDGIGEEINRMFLPFGAGRRVCPGTNLAYRVLGLALGAIIQCFELKKVPGDEIDMTPGGKITLRMKIPLEVMLKARPIIKKIV